MSVSVFAWQGLKSYRCDSLPMCECVSVCVCVCVCVCVRAISMVTYLWMTAKRSSVVRGRVGVTMATGALPLTLGDGEASAVLGSNTSPE